MLKAFLKKKVLCNNNRKLQYHKEVKIMIKLIKLKKNSTE